MPDHIHLFIEANPFDSPTNIVKIFKGVTSLRIFKGVTSLRIFKKFPELRQELWHGVLWSPSYYFGTAEVIEKYIQGQQTKWLRERNSSTG